MNDPYDEIEERHRQEGVESASDFIKACIAGGAVVLVIIVVIVWMRL